MLRRLELRGFKSFATSTALDLGPGVNVIVGPNGSGKSNLAEALVWAMGEQRAGRLRAGSMGDIVFSGGAGRQPAGLAEVSMTLAREGEVDVGAPAETRVTRRVTRSGDAHYRLDGVGCRLLDVHERLAGLGLGPDALAVIRQGQVEAVCAAKPAELRAVIEEAAGVALQKRRRKRAEGKLARVAERLDRARDLSVELVARRGALERQARQAERAAALDGEIETGRARLAAASAVAAHRAVAECRAAAQSATADLGGHETALHGARLALTDADARVGRAEAVRDAGQDLARALRSAGDRLASRAELATERVDQARRAVQRGDAERQAAVAARDDAERAAQRAAFRVGRAEEALAVADAALVAARDAHAASSEAARAGRTAADDARQAADEVRRDAATARARADRARRALAAAEERLARLGADGPLPDLARLERRADVAVQRGVRWGARLEDARREAADAAAARAVADETRRDAAAELQRTGGGGGPAADTLGAGLRVVPGAERAVGAALGHLADAVACADVPAGLAAVDGGAAAAVVPVPDRPVPPAPDGARPLMALVAEVPPGMRAALGRVLADVWLVDDLALVPPGHPGVFVTHDGALLRGEHGVVSRPASDWARAALHVAAAQRLAEAEVRCDDLRALERAARDPMRAVEARVRAADRCAERATRTLGAGRAAAGRLAADLADLATARDTAHREMAEADVALPPAEAAQASADAAAGVAREAADADAARVAADAATLRDAEAAAATARAELAASRVADAEAAERLAGIQRRAASRAHHVDLTLPTRALAALQAAAQAMAACSRTATDEAAGTAAALASDQRHRGEAREGLVVAETALESARAAAHEAQLRLAAATARAEEHGPPPPGDPGEVDPERERSALEALEGRRRALGAVNPLAAEEHAEVAGRIDEIQEQVDDLQATADALSGHMQGLETVVTDGFQTLFAAVRQRFTENIGTLFPGGDGRLVEVTPEDGEPGIEVQVVPAGKRPRSLALLSGGERSLVALAFCMAIAMTRPAPFYLLDEVEAALDDSNLRRFLALVRKLSHTQQFLLITHQQPTVEIADTLFGVTMARDGVSQVVSRRLEHAMEGGARPFVRRQLTAIRGGRA